MKGRIRVLALICCVMIGIVAGVWRIHSGDGIRKEAALVLSESARDLGTAIEGQILRADFVVANRGSATLILRRESSCLCTGDSVSSLEIPPGGAGTISAELDTSSAGSGTVTKAITYGTNDPNRRAIRLLLTANVQREFLLSAGILNLGVVAPGTRAAKALVISYARGDGPRVVEARCSDGDVVVELMDAPAGTSTKVTATVRPGASPGRHDGVLLLRTGSGVMPLLRVPLLAEVSDKGDVR